MKNKISSLILVSIALLLVLGVGLQSPGQVGAAPELETEDGVEPEGAVGLPLLAAQSVPSGYTDTIAVDKTAQRVMGCRAYEITLNITGTPPRQPMDVILVLDKSGSMFRNISGTRVTPMDYLKPAAKDFAKSILDAHPENRVAVVWFHGPDAFNKIGKLSDASLTRGFTDDLSLINAAINGVQQGYGTNIQAGFRVAKNHMNDYGRDSVSRAIVLMTDGVANASIGKTTYQNQNEPTEHNEHTKAAIEEGQSCWDIKGGTSVFTIGLFNAITNSSTRAVAEDTLEQAQNKGYYDSPTAAHLSSIFDAILVELDYSATNAVVTDSIPTDKFDFVDFVSHSQGSAPSYDPDTGTVTWNAGTIGTDASLKLKIKAKESYQGGNDVATNNSALLTYTDINGTDGKTKTFPVPLVNVPGPLTADAGADRNVDIGDSTILGGNPVAVGGTGPYTYLWSSSTNPNWSSSQANPTVEPTVDTVYTVAVTDSYGCPASDSVEVKMTLKGSITVHKFVEKGSKTRKFAIYIKGGGHTWSMMLADGESATISNLAPGTYSISEVVPMDYKMISISQSSVTISQSNPNGEVTITNEKVNNRWFRHRKQRINTFKVKTTW